MQLFTTPCAHWISQGVWVLWLKTLKQAMCPGKHCKHCALHWVSEGLWNTYYTTCNACWREKSDVFLLFIFIWSICACMQRDPQVIWTPPTFWTLTPICPLDVLGYSLRIITTNARSPLTDVWFPPLPLNTTMVNTARFFPPLVLLYVFVIAIIPESHGSDCEGLLFLFLLQGPVRRVFFFFFSRHILSRLSLQWVKRPLGLSCSNGFFLILWTSALSLIHWVCCPTHFVSKINSGSRVHSSIVAMGSGGSVASGKYQG